MPAAETQKECTLGWRHQLQMTVTLTTTPEGVDWEALADVFERAPLGAREPEKLRRAFEKSYRVCFAFHGERLIGAGRAISDGEYYTAIYDVVVAPEHQGQGVGARIMSTVLEDLPPGPVLLFAVPGKEAFYERFGFHRLKTGMARFANPDSARKRGFIE